MIWLWFKRFGTLTPIWIHWWLWHDTHSFYIYGRDSLIFVRSIKFSKLHRPKNWRFCLIWAFTDDDSNFNSQMDICVCVCVWERERRTKLWDSKRCTMAFQGHPSHFVVTRTHEAQHYVNRSHQIPQIYLVLFVVSFGIFQVPKKNRYDFYEYFPQKYLISLVFQSKIWGSYWPVVLITQDNYNVSMTGIVRKGPLGIYSLSHKIPSLKDHLNFWSSEICDYLMLLKSDKRFGRTIADALAQFYIHFNRFNSHKFTRFGYSKWLPPYETYRSLHELYGVHSPTHTEWHHFISCSLCSYVAPPTATKPAKWIIMDDHGDADALRNGLTIMPQKAGNASSGQRWLRWKMVNPHHIHTK